MTSESSSDPDQRRDTWSAALNASRLAMETHEGRHVYESSLGIWRSYNILRTNHSDLLELLNAPESDQNLFIELVQNVRAPTVRDAYWQEFARRLQNHTASVTALIDHTRVVMRRVESREFSAEYERRVAQVAANPVAAFVQKFRNYVLHYRFPAFAHRASWSDPPKVEMLLSRESLLDFDGWTAGARDYLQSANEQFDVRDPLVAYEQIVVEMYEWFFPAYDAAFADVLRGYDSAIRSYNAVLSSASDLP